MFKKNLLIIASVLCCLCQGEKFGDRADGDILLFEYAAYKNYTEPEGVFDGWSMINFPDPHETPHFYITYMEHEVFGWAKHTITIKSGGVGHMNVSMKIVRTDYLRFREQGYSITYREREVSGTVRIFGVHETCYKK